MTRTALVASHSHLESDPRIRRQIDWLVGAGWRVDTLGMGPAPDGAVREHFAMGRARGLAALAPVKALLHLLAPRGVVHRAATESRIPAQLRHAVGRREYDAIVLNELEFLPWLRDRRAFPTPGGPLVHVDLHEYHARALPTSSLERRIAARQYRWRYGFIAHPSITSRSTVADGIADRYADELLVPRPGIVRNSPPAEALAPRPASGVIRLLFHGMASWVRGFDQILDALQRLPDRFEMTFMLTPNRDVVERLRERIGDAERIRIVPPVPMREVARRINDYDLEIIFYPPTSVNYELSLPNKFFEAVQGRVGVVIGRSPEMLSLVERYGNGIVVNGWTGRDLAEALRELTTERIDELKAAAHVAAAELNAEHEGREFLALLEGRRR